MSTDRELLELAAKAAGLSAYVYIGPEGLLEWVDETDDEEGYFPNLTQWWNPLRNRGDALWLAVTLSMDFTLSGKHAAVAQSGRAIAQEFCNGDPYAATCRAITRAAAEIGRSMK